jgi:hypothetical protein
MRSTGCAHTYETANALGSGPAQQTNHHARGYQAQQHDLTQAPHLCLHRPAGFAQRRPAPAGPIGSDRPCVRRRGHVRGADCQIARCRSHRPVQDAEDGDSAQTCVRLFTTNGMHYRVTDRDRSPFRVERLPFGCRGSDDLPVVGVQNGHDLIGGEEQVGRVGPPHSCLQI